MTTKKEDFLAKLENLPIEEPTAEEAEIFAASDAARAAGEYGETTWEEYENSQRRMTLRLPHSLHKELQTLSRSEDMSLNQYIVYALGRFAESQHPQFSK